MIPKIIHYCWLSNDPYPEELKKYMQTWKEKLPDYEFILWNFDRFDKKSSKWVEQAFDNKKYAFAADYIRLFAIYNYGGIYMDMDIQVLKSFNNLLDSDLMMAYENNRKNGIEAGCFGASKNNPVIKECLDYYENRNFIKEDGTFDTLPLPSIMQKSIKNLSELDIKSCDYFTCKSFETGEITTTENSYAIHNFAGSWTSKEQQKYYSIKRKLNKKFSGKFLHMLCLIPLLKWQIREFGIKKVFMKIYKKIYTIF